ncbi:MAG: MerR family transcriptional regulator [Clostridia bacterium]|nr:MerR family transcriptional regulator [Clostridia bacterium]
MSNYTTGELAKLCGVTVRTVQYYDTRGILVPSNLSEGGRRLYSEDDLRRMRVICFLRELDLPLDVIGQMLAQDGSGNVITLLLQQQEQVLKEEIGAKTEKLEKLETLRRELKSEDRISLESIGDIAYTMNNQKKLKKVRLTMLFTGLPVTLLELAGILLWVLKGLWWVFALYVVIAVPWGILISRYYYKSVAYLCPQCHTVFKPSFKEMFWARHTPRTRKLTCTHCGRKGFCVEVAATDETTEAK